MRIKLLVLVALACSLIVGLSPLPAKAAKCPPVKPSTTSGPVHVVADHIRFAVIGDFGTAGKHEEAVANLVKSWNPDFIFTVGDNNYQLGDARSIDRNIGQYYHDYIYPYTGKYGKGATFNRFFPLLGNHDWETCNAQPYLDYFALPGNERYYDFTWGPVTFFAVDSQPDEPDGVTSTSKQAQWLHSELAASDSVWKIVAFHHPAYSSGIHGSTRYMQWPFQEWGASIVLNGHDHDYERIIRDGFPYIVDGLGGDSMYPFLFPIQGSVVRYTGEYGAMLVEADSEQMTFQFFTSKGELIDTYTMHARLTF